MAEALQDLITKNAKNNEIEDVDQEARGAQDDEDSDTNAVKPPKKMVNVMIIRIRMTTITKNNTLSGHMGATQEALRGG